ncbi:hypothetical protein CXB51_014784 [Gossypium anomalum]|uniref:Late embryogenesis abundant protein LEA-2 subgroup domain-containing protein n=1 Tax=Gossypium anomalum TaxID=47600 RepID=A0A8J5YKG1_9ROSI|nr:hypothetical protein CXB51_014784 [Gossypium anomalum]
MSKQDLRHSSVPYSRLSPNPNHQNVVVLPVYYPRHNDNYRCLRHCLAFTSVILLLSSALFLLYPSDPTLELARLQLNHVGVNTSPKLTLDLSFSLTIRVRNRDFFSLDYDKLVVSVGYRGRELGLVSSEGGRVRARGSSYVNATLDLDGFEVVHDVIYLLSDWAKGVVPFDTNTKVDGDLGLFLFKIPLKVIPFSLFFSLEFDSAINSMNKQKFCEVKAVSFLLVGGSGSVGGQKCHVRCTWIEITSQFNVVDSAPIDVLEVGNRFGFCREKIWFLFDDTVHAPKYTYVHSTSQQPEEITTMFKDKGDNC